MIRMLMLLLIAIIAMATHAQSNNYNVTFTDSDGAVVADGTTVTISQGSLINDDGWSYVVFDSGICVENKGENAIAVAVTCTIDGISNGALQICFPVNCQQFEEPGTYTTAVCELAAGERKSLQSEWLPEDVGRYGTCSVQYRADIYEYQLQGNTYVKKAEGPAVSVSFAYTESSGINGITADSDGKTEHFNVAGQRMNKVVHGIDIIRDSQGKVTKVIR